MIKTHDWQCYNILASLIIGGSYVIVLSRENTFQEVVDRAIDFRGKKLGDKTQFCILNTQILSSDDADFLEQNNLVQVVI